MDNERGIIMSKESPMEAIITFDESAKELILSFFDKVVDNDGFIVEKNDRTKRILASDGKDIKISEFAGMKDGIFFRNDISSILSLVEGT
jgi:hypothetical protein